MEAEQLKNKRAYMERFAVMIHKQLGDQLTDLIEHERALRTKINTLEVVVLEARDDLHRLRGASDEAIEQMDWQDIKMLEHYQNRFAELEAAGGTSIFREFHPEGENACGG